MIQGLSRIVRPFFFYRRIKQENDRADDRIDDFAKRAAPDRDAEPRQKPSGDERADDSNEDIADNSEPVAADD
jgi:hypothetical protein